MLEYRIEVNGEDVDYTKLRIIADGVDVPDYMEGNITFKKDDAPVFFKNLLMITQKSGGERSS